MYLSLAHIIVCVYCASGESYEGKRRLQLKPFVISIYGLAIFAAVRKSPVGIDASQDAEKKAWIKKAPRQSTAVTNSLLKVVWNYIFSIKSLSRAASISNLVEWVVLSGASTRQSARHGALWEKRGMTYIKKVIAGCRRSSAWCKGTWCECLWNHSIHHEHCSSVNFGTTQLFFVLVSS